MNNIPLNIDWQQILLHLFNFTVLFGILYFLLYAPIKKFMESRAAYYKELDDHANKTLQDAEAIKSDYESKLNEAAEEISAMKEKAGQEAAETSKRTLEKSQAEAEKIMLDAKSAAEREKEKVLLEAKSELSQIVSEAVKKIVIDSDTQASYDAFLNEADRGEADA